MPGIEDFTIRSSPRTHEEHLKCPVWLFHALDDTVVPASQSQQAEKRLKQAGKEVTLLTVPRGNHYNSMIQQGIPTAITWIRGRTGFIPKSTPTKPTESRPTRPPRGAFGSGPPR
jgi:acetyl esterase/lipase